MYPIALSGQTFSLGHILVVSIPDGAITVAHGDRETIAAGDCGGVRRRVKTLLRRLTRHEIASRYRTRTAEGAPGPPEASDMQADDGGGTCAISDGVEEAVMVKNC